jgi:hypothetical protein
MPNYFDVLLCAGEVTGFKNAIDKKRTALLVDC